MFSNPVVIVFVLVVNLIALFMTWLAWKRPPLGRLAFALMFFFAAGVNFYYALADPEEYVYYADFAMVEGYRSLILNASAETIRAILIVTALAQLAVAGAFLSSGRLLEIGALAGVVFLLAIAPLGWAAAFPATVIQAIGAYLIYRGNGGTEERRKWK
jgi:hypothetical protein